MKNFTRPAATLLLSLILALRAFSQGPYFTEVSIASGINHVTKFVDSTFPGEGGVAMFDYNNDGFEDFFITGGSNPVAMYKNNGDGTFTDVTIAAGFGVIDSNFITDGVAIGDIDNDGYDDLFITCTAPYHNMMFHNNGNGTFTDITATSMVGMTGNSSSAAFGDFNKDGLLDLYVTNWCMGMVNNPGQNDTFPSMQQFLYINMGNNTFMEESRAMGVADSLGCGMGVLFTDYNNTGNANLFVVNDFGWLAGNCPNQLYKSNYPATGFTNVSTATNANVPMDAMGMTQGDYDNDGYLDYFIANAGPGVLEHNNHGTFTNVCDSMGLNFGNVPLQDFSSWLNSTGWGCGFLDYDNDTYLDLFMANGDMTFGYPRPAIDPNRLFRNNPATGKFMEVSAAAGVNTSYCSRGFAFGDFNNDGHLDLFATTVARDTVSMHHDLLYKNNLTTGNWLKIKTIGVMSNRDGYGARVEVVFGNRKLIREVDGGSSYNSHVSSIVHFGLGETTMLDTLRIKWPSGIVDVYTNISVNQYIKAVEGISITGISEPAALPAVSKFEVFPNPVNGNTVTFDVNFAGAANADIMVYDMLGNEIATVAANRMFNQGDNRLTWQVPSSLGSGVYICRVNSGNFQLHRNLVVIK